ncbi:MAG: hypothetical protein J6K19_03890 [Prevotella sp.]|nr:hypothetical protein [Prevotella sp.]
MTLLKRRQLLTEIVRLLIVDHDLIQLLKGNPLATLSDIHPEQSLPVARRHAKVRKILRRRRHAREPPVMRSRISLPQRSRRPEQAFIRALDVPRLKPSLNLQVMPDPRAPLDVRVSSRRHIATDRHIPVYLFCRY